MRKFRLFLLTLLCLALPLQGMAGVRMAASPCPMEQEMMAMSTDQQDMAAMDHDCCNDAATAAKTGKMCKTSQDCQVSVQYLVIPQFSIALPSADSAHYPSIALSVQSFDASSVWRPPTRS